MSLKYSGTQTGLRSSYLKLSPKKINISRTRGPEFEGTSQDPGSVSSIPGTLSHCKTIPNLQPGSWYKVWVEAKTRSANISRSDLVEVRTYPELGSVDLVHKYPREVRLKWTAPTEDFIQTHQLIIFARFRSGVKSVA